MNKHFATVIVAANCALIIGFLSLRGLLPPAPEKIEEIIEERKVEASRCRNCTNAIDLSPGDEKLDNKLDDNAKNVSFVITKVHQAPKESSILWLETDHLLFRNIGLEDTNDLYSYACKPEVAQHHTWTAHKSKLETIELIKNWMSLYKKGHLAPWGIVEKSTNKLIGTGGITQYNDQEPRCIIGFTIGDAGWGKGYELEAARALVEFSLIMIKSNRTAALVRCDDTLGQKVLEKAGLSREGLEPDYKMINGTYVSLYHYALLRKEINPSILKHSALK